MPRSVQDPLTSNASNVTGTLNVLLAARDGGVRRVVFASSSSIYGANPALPKREDAAAAADLALRGRQARRARATAAASRDVYGLETVALRYFNVFGPRQDPLSQYSAVIPSFITRAARRRAARRSTATASSRATSPTSTTSCEANLLAMDAPGRRRARVYNVACGYSVSLNRLVEEIGALVGTEVAPRYTDPRAGDVRHSRADISAAVRDLAYEPLVSLEEGLERTLAYYKDQAMVRQSDPVR